MSRMRSIAISAGLIGTGAAAWAIATRSLMGNSDLTVPLNPLGINGSPYGEVFAMAMQSPIESYFHAGMGEEGHNHAFGEACNDPSAHEHQHDEACKHDHSSEGARTAEPAGKKPSASFTTRLGNLLGDLHQVREVRTNPKGTSQTLRRHLRRQAEDKLRFAYQLDPAHYSNYNSLHFFLTEPQIGTRPELTASAAKLAEETIQYCLKQDHDPRPALTAAAAACNILELMFNDRHNPQPKYTTAQMRQCLALLDHCLARYQMISRQWDASKQWDLLSPMRITECKERLQFLTKIRETAEKTILRLEQKPEKQQVSN